MTKKFLPTNIPRDERVAHRVRTFCDGFGDLAIAITRQLPERTGEASTLLGAIMSVLQHELDSEYYTPTKTTRGIRYVTASGKAYDFDYNAPGDDHAFAVRREKERRWISEPYILSAGTMKRIMDFCERRGLSFHISGQSRHFPGDTFRIEYYQDDT
jgi:hypothetical protein